MKALGAKTIGLATRKRPIEGFDEVDTLHQLRKYLPMADIVVSTLPSNSQTHHLFDLEDFELMKTYAMFINVGRGDLVPISVLEDVMKKHLIRYMILDVFETEPLPEESSLWQYENVFITPHIAGDFSLPETKELYMQLVLKNLKALANGTPFVNIVNR